MLSSFVESSKAVGHRHKGTGLAWSNEYDAGGQCSKSGLICFTFSFVFLSHVLFAQVMMNDEVQVVFRTGGGEGFLRSSVEYAAILRFLRF